VLGSWLSRWTLARLADQQGVFGVNIVTGDGGQVLGKQVQRVNAQIRVAGAQAFKKGRRDRHRMSRGVAMMCNTFNVFSHKLGHIWWATQKR